MTDGGALHLGPRAVVVLWRPSRENPPPLQPLVDACRQWYEPALGPVHARTRTASDGAVLVCLDTEALPDELPDVVVWGRPFSDDGSIGASGLRAALDRPERTRSWRGRFVIAGPRAAGFTLVSSADYTATLRRAEGPGGIAVATKGVPALLAAGLPARVDPERVAELVMFHYMLGDDELLDGLEVLSEASVVHSGWHGITTRVYWPIGERLTPGPEPTDAEGLRRALAQHLAPVVRAGDVSLALSAGRDSVLLASVLAEHNLAVRAVTMGDATMPDGAGGRAVAEHLGWSHTFAPVDPTAGASFERAVRLARWNEGLQNGSDTAGPQLQWPAQGWSEHTWLTGSAGEMGRARLWADKPDGADPLDVLVRGRAEHLDTERAERFARRVEVGFQATCAGAPQTGLELLDVVYIRGYMRKWLPSIDPPPDFVSVLAAYAHPDMIKTLLAIPRHLRRDASVMDEALGMGSYDLRTVALRAADASLLVRRHRNPVRRLQRRLRSRLDPYLQHVLDELGEDLRTRDILGQHWWDLTLQRAPTSGAHVRWLWNVVSVEALLRALDDAPRL